MIDVSKIKEEFREVMFTLFIVKIDLFLLLWFCQTFLDTTTFFHR